MLTIQRTRRFLGSSDLELHWYVRRYRISHPPVTQCECVRMRNSWTSPLMEAGAGKGRGEGPEETGRQRMRRGEKILRAQSVLRG